MRLGAFLRDERGAVAILVSCLMPVMIGFGAMATDVGYFFMDRRQLQSASDMAVVSAAAVPPAKANETVRQVLDRNGYADATFVLRTGDIDRDAPRDDMFVPDVPHGALSIIVSAPTTIFLSAMFLDAAPTLSVRSDAVVRPVPSLAAGSRLLSLKKGVANTLLGAVTGTQVGVGLLGYEGLASAKIQLGDLLEEIALRTGLSGGTVGDVVSSAPALDVVAQAAAAVLERKGRHGQAVLARDFGKVLAKADLHVALASFLSVGDELRSVQLGYPSSGLVADVSVLSLLTGAVSSAGSGNLVEAPIDIPLLGKVEISMLVGEAEKLRPAVSVAEETGRIATAQVRTRLAIATSDKVAGLGVGLRLPVEVVVAGGSAVVESVECGMEGRGRRAVVLVTPGAAKVEIGRQRGDLADAEVQPLRDYARILDLPLVKVDAYGVASIRETTPVRVVFEEADIASGRSRTVRTGHYVSSPMADLLRRTDVRVQILGVGVGMGGSFVQNAVAALLQPLSAPLDGLVEDVMALAGTSIGEMDVRVDDVACTMPSLAG